MRHERLWQWAMGLIVFFGFGGVLLFLCLIGIGIIN